MNEGRESRPCANCGVPLKGPYCYACGQPTRSFIRALPGLIREIASDTLYYDSRMWRTLYALICKPGTLSHEYVFGRRARYTSPIRLYLVSSILAFLMVGLAVDTEDLTLFGGSAPDSAVADEETARQPVISFGGEAWDREDNPLEIDSLGQKGNAWLNRQIEKLVENSREARRDPQRFVRTALGMLPQTMFVLLPLFSALTGLFYLFARRYYIEHLLLQVHNHSFIFLALIALYLLDATGSALAAAGFYASNVLAGSLSLASILVWLWIPVYLFLSLKRFYEQGWILTSLKFMALAWVYFFLLLFALVAVIILGILRL